MNDDERQAWERLSKARSKDDQSAYELARNELIERYLPLLQIMSAKAHKKTFGRIDVAELESAGLDGLIDAIEKFDLSRGIRFSTYAAQRIFGAIVDYQRSVDPNSRAYYNKQRAIDRLSQSLGHVPTNEEVFDNLGFQALRDRRALSIDQIRSTKLGEFELSNQLRSIERPFSGSDLSYILQGLSGAERLAILLYYVEERTMKEIGKELDLSESRISQMISGLMPRLRNRMEAA